MKVYDLYGHNLAPDLEAALPAAERALDVKFALHNSSYIGDYYRHGLTGFPSFALKRNFNLIEQDWTEELFKDYPVLLYVSEVSSGEEFEGALISEGFALLRRQKL